MENGWKLFKPRASKHPMARYAQAATELIIILGVALVVVVLFFSLSANMLTGARTQQNYDDARVSVQALVEAADSVYAQGEGATRKVMIILPADTKFGSTYIGAPSSANATQNAININVNGTDVIAFSRTSLSGKFPTKAGRYPMKVSSRGSYVEIYPYLLDVDRRSVSIVMAPDETRSAQITVTRISSEAVSVVPSQDWGFEGVSLATDPSGNFSASLSGSVMTVSVTSDPGTSGTYNSQLTLDALGAESGTTEEINIPISVEVVAIGGGAVACVQEGDSCRIGDVCCGGLECDGAVCGGIVHPPSCIESGQRCNPRMPPECCEGICNVPTDICP